LAAKGRYLASGVWWRLLLRDLDACKGQGRGNAWLRFVIGDETLSQHLATPAEELTGANPTLASHLRDRISRLARFCDELQLFLVAPAPSTLRPCYDFDPPVHPSSA
jgi:hypothetical protein